MEFSVLSLFLKSALSDYVVLGVLVTLLVMSILSWAVFFFKLIQFSSTARREKGYYMMIETPFR